MTSGARRTEWEYRHRGRTAGGDPEPFLLEVLPLLPRTGLALDVAAGRGRHGLVLADSGLTVVAVDYSQEAMRSLAKVVHARGAAVWPVVADLDNFCLLDETFDLIMNVNYLDRALFGEFIRALKPGGMLLAETFTVDQAAIGHPRDPRFLLEHYELRGLVGELDLVRYQEGLRVYPDGTRAWRAAALAEKERR